MPVRDSLSKCNTYSNPYDTRNHPIPKESIKPLIPTGSNSRDMLDRNHNKGDMIDRMRASWGRSSEGTPVLVRLGKGVFLVVLLPPYFLMVGLPKWMLLEASPAIMSWLLSQGQLVAGLLMKFAQAFGNQIMNGIDPIQRALRSALNKFSGGMSNLGALARNAVDKSLSPFRIVISQLSNLGSTLAAWGNRTKGALNSGADALKALAAKALWNPLVNGAEWMQNAMKGIGDPITSRMGSLSEKIGNQLSAFRMSFAERMASNEKWMDEKMKAIRNVADQSAQAVKDYVVQPLLNWIVPKAESLALFLANEKNRVKEVMSRMATKAKKKIEGIAEPVKMVIDQSWLIAQQMTMWAPQMIKKMFGGKEVERKSRVSKVYNKLKKGADNLYQKCRSKIKEAIHTFKELIVQSWDWLINGMRIVIQKSLSAIRWAIVMLFKLSLKAFKATGRFFVRVGRIIKFCLIFTSVLFQLGFQGVIETVDEIFKVIRFLNSTGRQSS